MNMQMDGSKLLQCVRTAVDITMLHDGNMLMGECLEAQSANILDPVGKIISLDSKYSNTK
jgi:hypothetical protein